MSPNVPMKGANMVSCISMRMLVHLALNPVCIYPVGKSLPAGFLGT